LPRFPLTCAVAVVRMMAQGLAWQGRGATLAASGQGFNAPVARKVFVMLGKREKEIPMRKISKSVVLAALAALAVPAAPALAQEMAPAEKRDMSPDEKAAMKAWPEDTKAFYSSLSQEQQQIFWQLSDEDKVNLSRMEPTQRDNVMRQLEARSNAANPGAAANPTNPTGR
jgi:hypothetical protein